MTGLSVLRQVYSLMDKPAYLIEEQGSESGLMALNQICNELWHREHTEDFVPLDHIRQQIDLSWRYLPAVTYGTAALLCLRDATQTSYDRFLDQYLRVLSGLGGMPRHRADVLPTEATV